MVAGDDGKIWIVAEFINSCFFTLVAQQRSPCQPSYIRRSVQMRLGSGLVEASLRESVQLISRPIVTLAYEQFT